MVPVSGFTGTISTEMPSTMNCAACRACNAGGEVLHSRVHGRGWVHADYHMHK